MISAIAEHIKSCTSYTEELEECIQDMEKMIEADNNCTKFLDTWSAKENELDLLADLLQRRLYMLEHLFIASKNIFLEVVSTVQPREYASLLAGDIEELLAELGDEDALEKVQRLQDRFIFLTELASVLSP